MKTGIDHIGISVGALLCNEEGKYLLGLRTENCRDEQNRWEPAGGGTLEFGERIIDGIIREAREEVGATPYDIEFVGIQESFRTVNDVNTHWIAIFYRAKVNPAEVKIMEPDKCAELRWCSIDEIPEPMHSQFPSFLEKYRNKL